MKTHLLILVLVCLGLSACSGIALPGLPGTGTPSEPLPTAALTSTPAIVPATPTPGPTILRIWLPPQFDPSLDSPASRLLQEQLDAFVEQHPGVRIEVRIKALDGPGGLLDALSAANSAAPLALPDLILLPRAHLETAASKVINPFDGLSILNSDDWYDYAKQLARLQDNTFGLPGGRWAGHAYCPARSLNHPRIGQPAKLTSPLIFRLPMNRHSLLYSNTWLPALLFRTPMVVRP
jgi:ABC-type glycerol-3-phosphate transport system substrate-binding protein